MYRTIYCTRDSFHMGSVERIVCYRKAIEESKGNLAKLKKICEKKDIRFFIGEV